MNKEQNRLFKWQECVNLNIEQIHDFYRKYVNKMQVNLSSSFGFGRTLAKYAEGMYIYTIDDRKILDFTGGQGVLSHGHNHPRILKARIEYQRQKRMEVHKHFFSQYIAALSHNIAQLLPGDLNISYFCNSGAEAVEGSVKLAYKSFNVKRKYILHADISFHGKLLGAGGLTGSLELMFKFPTIPNIVAFEYDNIESVKSILSRIRKDSGESDIYAIILEPFSASSLTQCSTSFLQELRKICTKEKIVLIFDEVYTCWAKTGELFYFFKHDVVPDIVTYSKSFGGGKSSIAGYTAKTSVFNDAYGNMKDAVLHSTTYNGFGEETITAIEAINIIVEEDYPAKAKHIYEILNPGLKRLQEKYPNMISAVKGCGALNGIVLNKDVNSALRTALNFVPGDLFNERFFGKLFTAAVMSELFTTHNILTSFGENKDISLFISPSLIATDGDLKRFLDALDQTLSHGKLKLLVNFAKQKFLKS